MWFSRKDELLDHPLLTEDEIKGLLADVRAEQKGEIKTIVGTEFWQRAMAEMARRQAKLQTDTASSTARWTIALAILTGVLAIAAIAQVLVLLR